MSLRPKDPLLTAGRILTLLFQGLVGLGMAVLTIGIPVILLGQGKIAAELAADHPGVDFTFPAAAIVLVMALAIAALALVFVFFKRLRQIINTVGEGDPFVPENADRLSIMAWLMLGVHLLTIPIGLLAMHVATEMEDLHEENFSFDAGLDGSGVLMIITLFILARVFRQGTQMREELEGTV